MDKNKRLAELLGICWHERVQVKGGPLNRCECSCGKPDSIGSYRDHVNPDFTSDAGKVQLLRLMREHFKDKDYEFSQFLFSLDIHGTYPYLLKAFIDTYITDTTGKLRDACIKWLEKEA